MIAHRKQWTFDYQTNPSTFESICSPKWTTINSCCCSFANALTSVVLPHPLGPSNTTQESTLPVTTDRSHSKCWIHSGNWRVEYNYDQIMQVITLYTASVVKASLVSRCLISLTGTKLIDMNGRNTGEPVKFLWIIHSTKPHWKWLDTGRMAINYTTK